MSVESEVSFESIEKNFCATPENTRAADARRLFHSAANSSEVRLSSLTVAGVRLESLTYFNPAFNSRSATANSGSLFIVSAMRRVACITVV